MFSKTDKGASGHGGGLSFIGREVTVTGNIGGSGNLHVDGAVHGDIQAASVTLGTEGRVHGNIVADAAQIAGTVEGTVAAKSLVVEATARIIGDMSYDAVSIATGAQVEGRVKRLTRGEAGQEATAQRLLGAD